MSRSDFRITISGKDRDAQGIIKASLYTQLTTFSRARLSLSEAKTPMSETKNMTTPRTMRITAGAKNTPSSVL